LLHHFNQSSIEHVIIPIFRLGEAVGAKQLSAQYNACRSTVTIARTTAEFLEPRYSWYPAHIARAMPGLSSIFIALSRTTYTSTGVVLHITPRIAHIHIYIGRAVSCFTQGQELTNAERGSRPKRRAFLFLLLFLSCFCSLFLPLEVNTHQASTFLLRRRGTR
jgi:hypothetical protein